MKGDFTRRTFRQKKHYHGVRQQQGRVQVDADFNEYVDIQSHLRRTSLGDIIGLCGGPQDNAAFKLTPASGSLTIGKGHYYVDGILCENDDDNLSITQQPDLPGQTNPSAPGKGYYLAYLDVWPRHITALEDSDIREVALGGADTATRTKTVWQVKLLYATEKPKEDPPGCADAIFTTPWDDATKLSDCLLSAAVDKSEEDPNKPCIVPARAGYRGLENQLYRVEIHSDAKGKETFKWSRENGSVVFPITHKQVDSSSQSHVQLTKLSKDSVLSLSVGDWVEILGDTTELNCEPGTMAQVMPESKIAKGEIVLSCDISSHQSENNLKIRRWDQKKTSKVTLSNGAIPIKEGASIPLEQGITVKFKRAAAGKPNTYHTGDYWLIPARTATRDIDWPTSSGASPVPLELLPEGILHHYCRLAVLFYDEKQWTVIHDCRRLFPPLTEMIRLHYVAGDGQEAMPGKPLPKPLQVSVVNGQERVANAKIQFKVVDGSGKVKKYTSEAATPCLGFTSGGTNNVRVQTGDDGIASACWRLDSSNLSQQVEATLLEVDGKPMTETVGGKEVPFLPPIRFNANLSVASQVYYDSQGCTQTEHPSVDDVQDALDALYCNAALYYVGGDGQEALPGKSLPQPLQVRVANGKWPVARAKVVFAIEKPGQGVLKAGTSQGTTVEVTTDGNGLASCGWKLDDKNDSQRVKAYLQRYDTLPVYFNANLERAGSNVSCCITVGKNGDYNTLREAIINLRKQKQTDICLCLLPDAKTQALSGKQLNRILSASDLSISITGSGAASPLQITDSIQCTGINSFSLTDAEIEIKYVITAKTPGLVFKDCKSVSFNSCKISGITDVANGGALLSIGTTDRVSLKDNVFNAKNTTSDSAVDEIVRETGDESIAVIAPAPPAVEVAPVAPPDETVTVTAAPAPVAAVPVTVYVSDDSPDVVNKIRLSAENLVNMDKTKRITLGKNIIKLVSGTNISKNLSNDEAVNISKLGLALTKAEADIETVAALLTNVKRATSQYQAGVAVVLGEGERKINKKSITETRAAAAAAKALERDTAEDEMVIVENNKIAGVISLYGDTPVVSYTEFLRYLKTVDAQLRRGTASASASSGTFLSETSPALQIPTIIGLQGTLQIRGNHLVGIVTGKAMLAKLKEYASSDAQTWQLSVFARCIMNANVIEGMSVLLSQHLSLATNDFAMGAMPSGGTSVIQAGGSIADSSVFVGNQGCRPGINWLDMCFSPRVARETNPWMYFNT